MYYSVKNLALNIPLDSQCSLLCKQLVSIPKKGHLVDILFETHHSSHYTCNCFPVTFHLIAIILQEPKQWVSSNFLVYIAVNNLVTLTIVFFLSSLVKFSRRDVCVL